MVSFLLKCSTLDIHAETYARLTAYQLAYAGKHQTILQELVSHGAEPIPLPFDDSDSDNEDVPTTVTKFRSAYPVTNVA